MEVSRDILPSFLMTIDGERVQGKNVSILKRSDVNQSTFFPDFLNCDRKQVLFSVSVSAKPGLGMVDVMIAKENLLSFFVYNPG